MTALRVGRKSEGAATVEQLAAIRRFMSKVDIDHPSGCWVWTAGTTQNGYGGFRFQGTATGAHRVSWEIHNGPIPDGLQVLHDCPGGDRRGCVNPDHLWLGTNADNMLDKAAKGRSNPAQGERHGAAKLTEADVLAIRTSQTGARSLARRYGVHRTNIWNIRNRKTWRHV